MTTLAELDFPLPYLKSFKRRTAAIVLCSKFRFEGESNGTSYRHLTVLASLLRISFGR
jgi:hypothetical protein